MSTSTIKEKTEQIVRVLHQNRYQQLREMSMDKSEAFETKEKEIAEAVDALLQLFDEAVIKAKEEQIMDDFMTLVMGEVGDEVDEVTLITWRQDRIAQLKQGGSEK